MAGGNKSKKKKIICCTMASLIIVAAIVVIAVVASKSSDDSGGDSPAPSPPHPVGPGTPLDFKEYNPFKLDMASTEEQDWYFTGYINNTHNPDSTRR